MKSDKTVLDLKVDTLVSDPKWDGLHFDVASLAENIIALTLETANIPEELGDKKSIEVSVVLMYDEEVQRLNNSFRGQDKPTNILSFSALEGEEIPIPHPENEYMHLGDLILAYNTINKEAQSMGIPFQDHLTHLFVHGTLHLIGYDHQESDEAERMENLEIKILAGLGIENPYSHEKFVA